MHRGFKCLYGPSKGEDMKPSVIKESSLVRMGKCDE